MFDDVFWTIEGNEARRLAKGYAPLAAYTGLTERERQTQQVRKVFDLLVSPKRYDNRKILKDLRLGIARRKASARRDADAGAGAREQVETVAAQ